MIGTIVNTAAIVVGSAIGSLAKRGLGEKYQNILFCAMGLAATGLGLHSVVEGMTESVYPVLFIASLAIGGVAGTTIGIEGRFDRLTERLSKSKVDESGGTNLSRGLSTGIVLFCFGTLSILGPINSALYGDETFLLTNATLDFVTSMVLASSFGIGMALAGVVLFCWQGAIWVLAGFLPFGAVARTAYDRKPDVRDHHRRRFSNSRIGPIHLEDQGDFGHESPARALGAARLVCHPAAFAPWVSYL